MGSQSAPKQFPSVQPFASSDSNPVVSQVQPTPAVMQNQNPAAPSFSAPNGVMPTTDPAVSVPNINPDSQAQIQNRATRGLGASNRFFGM